MSLPHQWYVRVTGLVEAVAISSVDTDLPHGQAVHMPDFTAIYNAMAPATLNILQRARSRAYQVLNRTDTDEEGLDERDKWLGKFLPLDALYLNLDRTHSEDRIKRKKYQLTAMAFMQAFQVEPKLGVGHLSHFLFRHYARTIVYGWDAEKKARFLSVVRKYNVKGVAKIEPRDVVHVLRVLPKK